MEHPSLNQIRHWLADALNPYREPVEFPEVFHRFIVNAEGFHDEAEALEERYTATKGENREG